MQEDSPVKSKSKRTRTKKEAEPATKSTRRAVRGPAPKAPSPPREPTPPPREPTPEPPREPTPEPPREPTPEPPREPTPEPPREPTPEPIEEREPTPEPVVEREPTPEPVVEREPTPEPVERELSPESRDPTPEPIVERDPTPERQPSPEPIREPTPDLMDLNSEPAREPTPEAVKNEEDVFMEDEPKETLLSESEDEDEEKAPPMKLRSSWLSQALGNQVPRPSTAQRTSMNDYGGLRQSTMPPKRKSEEVEETKEKRPDKVARIDPATASPAPYDRKAGSATSLPAATISTPAPAAKVQAATEPERNTTKVAKALEEMRAAAAAKAKAANEQKRLAAAATPAPSTGSGFFRGIGSLFSFQNDAARQKREEDDRKAKEAAQAKLDLAMGVLNTEEQREKEEREKDEQAVHDSIMADNEEIPPPEQNLIDIGDDFDAIPDDLGSSALGSAGIVIDIDFAGSTTPPGSPPMKEETPKPKPPVPRKAANRPASIALASSSSQLFKTADRMASKVQGHKPAAPPVKSVARAADAAKKDQAAKDRREALRAQTERKKAAEKARKLEEERAAAEAEKKRQAEEAEHRRARLLAAEKVRKEREARIQQQRERAEREAEAARKAEEEKRKAEEEKRKAEEAARKEEADKRKAALQRSQLSKSGMKRIVPAPKTPGKTHARPPSTFRTAERASVQRLGPPQRTSQAGPSRASSTLQQQRATLQAQLDKKAVEAELLEDSGDVSLPSIRSEYSDSDDEPSESDFKRPAWAESPALRHALEAQAQVNPDELFGPIKPLRMDELFKERAGKFRARTSSANWNGADRLTEAEEREYARRMGFKPVNAPR